MHPTRPRSVALLLGLSISLGLTGCSLISDIVKSSQDKKAAEEAQAAKEAELAEAKAALEAKRSAALDAGATPDQVWEYTTALASVPFEVDPAWLPELEASLSPRIEGGLTADNALFGYALAQVYAALDKPDESASVILDLVKIGGGGPVTPPELFDAVTSYPRSEITDGVILELCPLVRPQVEQVYTLLSHCVERAGGDISKLSWEGVLTDLEGFARSSYARGPAAGTFTFHSKVKSYKRSFWALGYVENTSAVFLGNPKVTAVLLDKDGAELGSYTGYAMIDEVAPGVRAPVTVLVNDPPKYDSVRYEFNPEQADYLSDPVPGLKVEALKPKRGRFGWKVEGKVISESDKPAQFVKVVVHALDKDNQLVGATSTYVEEDKIEAGGTGRWRTTSMDVARKPDHWEYTVTARVAD